MGLSIYGKVIHKTRESEHLVKEETNEDNANERGRIGYMLINSELQSTERKMMRAKETCHTNIHGSGGQRTSN